MDKYIIELPEDEETKREMRSEDLTRRLLANQVCENCRYLYANTFSTNFVPKVCIEKNSSSILPRQGTCDKWEQQLASKEKVEERLLSKWRWRFAEDGQESGSIKSSSK